MLSDEELARAAQGGDAMSLGTLLERHRAPLYALALRVLGHRPQQAQDVVQDVFVVALSTIEGLREPKAVGGWLRAILRNVCLMQLREHRGEVPFDELPVGLGKDPEPSAEESIERLAMSEWVWTALGELPEPLRVTAILRYFGSYSSYEEISAILGVPIGTVSSRLSQAKVKLVDALLRTAGMEHDASARTVPHSLLQRSLGGVQPKGGLRPLRERLLGRCCTGVPWGERLARAQTPGQGLGR